MPAQGEQDDIACFMAGFFTGLEASIMWVVAVIFIAWRTQDDETQDAALIAVSALACMYTAASGVQTTAPTTIFLNLAGAMIAIIIVFLAFYYVVIPPVEHSEKE